DQDTSGPLTVSVAWRGWENIYHAVWADVVNGRGGVPGMGDSTSIVDNLVWFNEEERIATRTMSGSAVTPGLTNRIRVSGLGGGPFGSLAAFNWFEVTHARRYRAIGDYLDCNSSNVTGPALVRVGGFSVNDTLLRVYDVSDSTAPVRLVLDPTQVKPHGAGFSQEWEATLAAGRPPRYIAFRSARTLPNAYVTAVDRRHLTAPVPGSRIDYLVVTPEEFEPAVGP